MYCVNRPEKCIICASVNLDNTKKQFGYILYHCQNCGLQFWYPLNDPNQDWYANDRFYTIRNFLIPETLSKKYLLFLRREIIYSGKLLDIGCGTGMFAAYCKKKGYKVTGIDFNKKSVSVARNYWKLDNIYEMPFDQYKNEYSHEQFDVITFFEVLEHQVNPVLFIEKVKRLLVPGGYIALSVPNRERWDKLPPMNDYPPNHFTKWNCKSLVNLLSFCGFSIIEIKEVPFTIESARSILTGKLNKLKDKILISAIKKSSSDIQIEKKTELRKFFYLLFFIWRAFLLFPSYAVLFYARIFSKKDFSIYCLAKLED